MNEPLAKRRLRLWIRLLRVTRLAERQLGEFVRSEFGSTLPRFDVLAALDRADHPLTMSEISRQLLVSNGNTTAVVDRLEADGLVERVVAPADRRVVHVALTAHGRTRFRELAQAHERRVDELFGGIDGDDLDELERLLHHLTPGKVHQ